MKINISEVKLCIDQDLKGIKTVKCVATRLNVSSETLRKYFHRDEKISLSQYILHRKLDMMKKLLVGSKCPCYWICYEVGLREDSGAKIFKKHFGKTMEEFRRVTVM
ncbi:MAG TPA: AraC family transcriptional regulator [Nitrosomonas sp.]|nr:AraC family transcriptional regulator [Nitrosomonas sp.]